MISPDEAYELGRKLGLIPLTAILYVPALAVIAWSLVSKRRHRTNTKCALSVVFATIVLLILGTGGIVGLFFGTSPTFRSIAGFAALVLLVVAVVLAANGLKEMGNRFGELIYDRGRKRAIAVLTLPLIFAATLVAAVSLHSSGVPLFSSEIGGTAGQTIEDAGWNFQLIAPPPWVTADAKKLNAQACAGLARQGPQMFAVVVPEDVSKTADYTLAVGVAAVKKSLKDAAHEIVVEKDQAEGGLAGRRIESLAPSASGRNIQVQWLAYYGGIFYQLTVWGAESAREAVRAESQKLIAGFRIIDPNRNPLPPAERARQTFTSEKFGYSIDLTHTVWNRQWPALSKEVPFAEFGVLNERKTAAFCVIPVWLGAEDPGFDAIATALASRIEVPFPDPALFAMRNVRQGGVRGRAFAYERTGGGVSLLYRIRVLRGRGFAYLLVAWMNKKSEALSDFLDLAMDCVAFPDTVPVEPLLTGDRLRATHGGVWNDIGIALTRAGTPEAAASWFLRAFEIDRDNLVPLSNYAEVMINTRKAPEALKSLNRLALGDERPAIRRLQAQVQLASGNGNEAIRILTERRKRDPGDMDSALILVDTYLATQHLAEALRECDTLIAAAGDTIPLLQRKAVALAQLRRFPEAKQALETAAAKEPDNRAIKSLLEQLAALTAKPAR